MELNERITLYTGTLAADGKGGSTITWNGGVQLWASIDITQSGRLFIQDQEYNGTYYTVTLRTQDINYTPPLENYYVVWNDYAANRTFKILSAANERKATYTVLKCVESNG